MKSATRTFYEYGCDFARMVQSERVALFITYRHATVQGHRGGLPECAYEVRFPGACVGSEKIVKNI